MNSFKQAGDTRPVITQTLGDAWGLHLDDFNIDLGNLLTLVHDEAAVYSRHCRIRGGMLVGEGHHGSEAIGTPGNGITSRAPSAMMTLWSMRR